MGVLRYAVPALAVAGSAAAASCSGTTTIQSSGDATGLASCSTYSGDIVIATGTTDSINFSGIQKITGSLSAENVTQMSSLGATSLEEIGDSFELNGLTMLTTLNFPALKKVDTINWVALPALQGLSFTEGVEEINSLMIDNTYLASLDGINLQVADTFTVTNNPYLDAISMQLGNVTQALTIGANGKDLQVEFTNLEWAYNMTFRNCSQVSIPSLASINGSLGFYGNGIESLAAPNLTNVGGSLSFVMNDALTNISMPELTQIGGGFQLANNTKLEKISFPAVKTVGGALDFYGDFNEVDLPDLATVRGAFNLQSTENLDDVCSHFESLSGGSASPIQGAYTCSGQQDSPSGTGTLPDGTNSGGGSGHSSSAAHPMLIPGATGILGVVAAIFGLL